VSSGGATLTDFWNMGIRLLAIRNVACCLTGVLIGWFTHCRLPGSVVSK
jgi:hypothetical protein